MSNSKMWELRREVAAKMPPEAVRSWLEAEGWTRGQSTSRLTEYLMPGDGCLHVVQVPAAHDYIDYPRRFAEVVGGVAEASGRFELDILRELSERFDFESWRCECGFVNLGAVAACRSCGEPRPDDCPEGGDDD